VFLGDAGQASSVASILPATRQNASPKIIRLIVTVRNELSIDAHIRGDAHSA
jgi:hypothetical protein